MASAMVMPEMLHDRFPQGNADDQQRRDDRTENNVNRQVCHGRSSL